MNDSREPSGSTFLDMCTHCEDFVVHGIGVNVSTRPFDDVHIKEPRPDWGYPVPYCENEARFVIRIPNGYTYRDGYTYRA